MSARFRSGELAGLCLLADSFQGVGTLGDQVRYGKFARCKI